MLVAQSASSWSSILCTAPWDNLCRGRGGFVELRDCSSGSHVLRTAQPRIRCTSPCEHEQLPCAEAEEGEAEREHHVVLQYDGEVQTKAFVALAQQVGSVTQASNGALGIGIVSILGFEDTYRLLQARPAQAHCDACGGVLLGWLSE